MKNFLMQLHSSGRQLAARSCVARSAAAALNWRPDSVRLNNDDDHHHNRQQWLSSTMIIFNNDQWSRSTFANSTTCFLSWSSYWVTSLKTLHCSSKFSWRKLHLFQEYIWNEIYWNGEQKVFFNGHRRNIGKDQRHIYVETLCWKDSLDIDTQERKFQWNVTCGVQWAVWAVLDPHIVREQCVQCVQWQCGTHILCIVCTLCSVCSLCSVGPTLCAVWVASWIFFFSVRIALTVMGPCWVHWLWCSAIECNWVQSTCLTLI